MVSVAMPQKRYNENTHCWTSRPILAFFSNSLSPASFFLFDTSLAFARSHAYVMYTGDDKIPVGPTDRGLSPTANYRK